MTTMTIDPTFLHVLTDKPEWMTHAVVTIHGPNGPRTLEVVAATPWEAHVKATQSLGPDERIAILGCCGRRP